MSYLEIIYNRLCVKESDIHEHLPTLYKHAQECSHITECGVRNVVSSYAFALGLYGKENGILVQVDPYKSENIEPFQELCESHNIQTKFYEQSDLECPLEPTELLFIDTWHIYGHLKRELNRWHGVVSKYIILHDTTVDGELGENTRRQHCPIEPTLSPEEASKESGYPLNEVLRGLWPAITDFLHVHPEWKLRERFTNNNGLTVLERVTAL
jgi:hypothetical protein